MEQKNKATAEAPVTAEEIQENEAEITATEIVEEAPAAAEELVSELTKLKTELDEQKDKYIRLVADFENFKRHSAKERMELKQTAGKEVITALLDVMDNCDRAEKQLQTSTDLEQIKTGVELVFATLKNTLQAKGLKAMQSIHTEFDVEKHEAITEIPAPTEELKDKVLDEVQKGYYLNDKIIRFAKVVVGK